MCIRDSIYAVSEVNGLIKDLIDGTPQLSGLYIRGELSNYKIYPSCLLYTSIIRPRAGIS